MVAVTLSDLLNYKRRIRWATRLFYFVFMTGLIAQVIQLWQFLYIVQMLREIERLHHGG